MPPSNVESPSGIPATLVPWRSLQRGDATLIVAKVTYRCEDGLLRRASEQEPINAEASHWDDDSNRSLRAPSDVAISKRRPEIMLVGSAFAPGGTKVRRLIAVLRVMELEKVIAIHCDRWVDAEGEIHDEAAFSRMPLTWERAGTEGDSNPHGRAPIPDAYGRIPLPNLQQLGVDPGPPEWRIRPVAFAPVARPWPTWARGLRDASKRVELDETTDVSFFQSAPRDQQLQRFPADAEIVLENLLPHAQRVAMRLPGDRVRALVGRQSQLVELTADTILIDTDREILSVTWRGSFFASTIPNADRVMIVLDEEDVPILTTVEEAPRSVGLPFAKQAAPARSAAPSQPGAYGGTPFGPSAIGSAPPAPVSPRDKLGAALGMLPSMETTELPAITRALIENAMPQPRTPAVVTQALPAMTPPASMQVQAQPQPVQPPAPAPVQHVMTGPLAVPAIVRPAPAPAPVAAPTQLSPSALAAQVAPPSYMRFSEEPTSLGDGSSPSHDARAVLGGLVSASDAAATRADAPKVKPKPIAPAAPRAAGFLDLLWFAEDAADKLKKNAAWNAIVRDAPKSSEWLDDKLVSEARTKEDPRRDVARALARGQLLDASGVARAVLESVDDEGFLIRPIVAAEGEVSITFDPLEQLNVAVALSEPLAAADKKFKEVHDAVADLANATRKVTTPMIEAGLQRIRQAFASAPGAKNYSNGYLEATAERYLIEERKYWKRMILGDSRIIASLSPTSGGMPLVVYLPSALENVLPAVPKFKARVLAEPHAKQDAADGDPTSLLAIAFARVVGR